MYIFVALCVPDFKPPPWLLKQLGANIRRERTSKGMAQQQLAELADLNIRNVQRIETGESDAPLSTAQIQKALDCGWEKPIPPDGDKPAGAGQTSMP